MPRAKASRLSDCQVVFDFDNTITPFDTLDDIIARFSVNKDWEKLEEDWRKGRIGSRECLRGQLSGVRITRPKLKEYLNKIKVLPYFKKTVLLLKKEKAGVAILSDNFHFIIDTILKNNGIGHIPVYANSLDFDHARLNPSFPHINRNCWKCAHCKTKNLPRRESDSKICIYIGDGFSDICPAQKADIVFAKGSLLDYFRKKNLACRKISSLREVYDYFRKTNESGTKSS